jgi:peptide-methionine (S)-S-oxide reductase
MFRQVPPLPTAKSALLGRETVISITNLHYVNQNPIQAPWVDGIEILIVGMGCFWGAEKSFWLLEGVYSTAVGYSAGFTLNPTYQEVCSGQTAHNEVVLIAYIKPYYLAVKYMRLF